MIKSQVQTWKFRGKLPKLWSWTVSESKILRTVRFKNERSILNGLLWKLWNEI